MTKTRWVLGSSWLLLTAACGTAGPSEIGESEDFAQAEAAQTDPDWVLAESDLPLETAAVESDSWDGHGRGVPGLIDGPDELQGGSEATSQSVDKALFIDGSLSCNALPGLACPDVTVSAANGEVVLVDASDPRFDLIFRRNPAVTVREVHPARRAAVDLNSISCDLNGSGQPIRDVLRFRLPVETQASAISSTTIRFTRTARPLNYPGGMMDTFSCRPRTFTLSAPGFGTKRVQFQGRYFGHRMVTDAQTLNNGIGTLEVACDYSAGGTAARVEADRPRDVVSVSGSRFVTAETLSSSQTRQRCSAMCGDDCAISFGADALGAQNCTSVCTPECVSRATTSTGLCQAPNQCTTPCSHPSDCGDRNSFTCSSGCCIARIR